MDPLSSYSLNTGNITDIVTSDFNLIGILDNNDIASKRTVG